jgi:acetyl-CoA carboxylase carboxyltransferase component
MSEATREEGFTWARAVEELGRRQRSAEELGGADRVERRRTQGLNTVRERIEKITERFYEVGGLARFIERDADGKPIEDLPSSYVCGLGEVDGRPVAVGGDDFTVRGGVPQLGYLDRMKGGMGGFIEDLAHEYRIPLLLFMEGIGGDVATIDDKGHSYLVSSMSWLRCFQLMSEVPVVTAVMGAAAGGTGGRAVVSHFSVISKGSVMFAGGPPVVKRSLGIDLNKHDLGGAEMHTTVSGGVDNLAEDEDDAIAQMKRFLSYMPQNVWEMPPRGPRDDPTDRREESLLEIVPENRRRPYKMAKVIASNPMVLAGALDGAAADKQVRLFDVCRTFHLPIVYFVDVPGFMVGPDAERGNVLRKGMRAIQALIEAEVPVLTVHVRKAFGMAVSATSDPDSLGLRIAWPSAEWGDMPVEGGVDAAFRREIAAAEDPDAFRREAEQRLFAAADPWKTVEAFGVESMIDPRDTRSVLCGFLNASLNKISTSLGPPSRPWTMRP